MNIHQRDAFLPKTENIVVESQSAVFDDDMSCSFRDTYLNAAAAPPENISRSNGAVITVDNSSRDIPNTYSQNYREDCFPSETDCLPITLQSAASCDGKVHSDTLSSGDVSSATTWHMENVMSSADSAPIVAVGGAKEEELKQGLEQRLGLVLSKLARESDDDDQRWSVHITSDHVVEDSVVDESVSDAELTDSYDMCRGIHDMFVIDTVHEMDDVERYSYLSFVAYAMHQLFEYSAWNEYATLHLLFLSLIIILC